MLLVAILLRIKVDEVLLESRDISSHVDSTLLFRLLAQSQEDSGCDLVLCLVWRLDVSLNNVDGIPNTILSSSRERHGLLHQPA